MVAGSVGVGAAGGQAAFDSIVQRDAPDANRGRSFARFETRFQLIWVVGAVLGIIPMPMWLGFLGIAGVAAFAAVSYTAGARGAPAALVPDGPPSIAGTAPTAHELGFHDAPTRELPPTIVSPRGSAARRRRRRRAIADRPPVVATPIAIAGPDPTSTTEVLGRDRSTAPSVESTPAASAHRDVDERRR